MPEAIRILYLDDCDVDHRLLAAYLNLETTHTYDVTPCLTLDEARTALQKGDYDALILDNRVPPFSSYHEPYKHLKAALGHRLPTLVVSADVSGHEFSESMRQDQEIVLDKADLMAAIQSGILADVAAARS